jgi:hypothetical protein
MRKFIEWRIAFDRSRQPNETNNLSGELDQNTFYPLKRSYPPTTKKTPGDTKNTYRQNCSRKKASPKAGQLSAKSS